MAIPPRSGVISAAPAIVASTDLLSEHGSITIARATPVISTVCVPTILAPEPSDHAGGCNVSEAGAEQDQPDRAGGLTRGVELERDHHTHRARCNRAGHEPDQPRPQLRPSGGGGQQPRRPNATGPLRHGLPTRGEQRHDRGHHNSDSQEWRTDPERLGTQADEACAEYQADTRDRDAAAERGA